MYKIRNQLTGEFLNKKHQWSKKGKVWTERGHLSNHFALYRDPVKEHIGAEIVVIEEVISERISVADWIAGVKERREKRTAGRRRRREQELVRQKEMNRQQRQAQYEQLKKEFGA
jgi:hypothetical protein